MKYEELIERLRLGEAVDCWNRQREAADAIENLSCMIQKNMHVIENLKDSQHYSGRYIKSIMGVEE